MNRRRRSQFAPALSLANARLESRIVLSAAVAQHAAMELAGRSAATKTSVDVSAGTLGQPITFTVTVRAPASAGSPQGTINLSDRGTQFATATLSPTTSTDARFAYSQATYTVTPQPGDSAAFFGRHTVTATFTPSGSFAKSTTNKNFTVAEPAYTTLSDGTKVATIVPGTGPAIQSGQTASVLYTGYVAKDGKIFDDSANHGGLPLSYTVGGGQVIPGFDAGTAGMQVGETRILDIPASQAYGHTAYGPIPANSALIFVLTLQSIS